MSQRRPPFRGLALKLGAALALGFAALAGCADEAPGRVDPARHDAFFLWAGVRPGPELARAKTIYLLDGEVRHDAPGVLVALRPVAPRLREPAVWLTVRTERLDWGEGVYRRLLADARRWEAAGNRLVGVQIDFDAATKGIGAYAEFLGDLRRRLPARYRLSITGLLDWSANGDPAELARLNGVVDEVVVQTYQGRTTIPGYEGYVRELLRQPIPYRIGLVENGEWRTPPGLERDPEFRGYVVFLLP